MNPVSIAVLFMMFWLVGFTLAIVISVYQCSKTNAMTSVYEGFIWSLFPTIVYILLKVSPYALSVFSEGTKTIFGWTGFAADQAGYEKIGIAYAVVLIGLIVTTRMVHTVEVSVCKPDVAELAAFQADLMKSLAAKQQANKPDS
jgi:hypothetical protein